ncbi:GNAT family N-acetyltransferase [Salinisphaera sp. LB1]|uniref:GNAT family N-acetyltransferase n=1 Tax=Salinisphaera sp. LB1 TaxID=2183911 RepID=UPI000D7063E3|nr:GNAT family N-acetyltransferase [Salinisphaera sp. LB1]
MTKFRAHLLSDKDKSEWRPLFDGYAAFYKTDMTDAIADSVWGWLRDPEHVLEGLLVRNSDERAVGLLHFRSCPRPLSGRDMGFADDMFVLPEARGSGAADALFDRLGSIAAERDWPVVRWVTQYYNERGRGLYDRYTSGPSDFIMYQWDLRPRG